MQSKWILQVFLPKYRVVTYLFLRAVSKNTDFLRLSPYSRKNNIRTRIETKIGQTEGNQAKTTVSRALTRVDVRQS